MPTGMEKNREHERVFFSNKQRPTALLALPGIRSAIPAKVLDLSLGGMACALRRHPNLRFKAEDFLYLIEFQDIQKKRIPANIDIEIRWVIDAERFQNIGFGCSFVALSEKLRQELQFFIKQGLSVNHIRLQNADSKDFVEKNIL